MQEAVMNSREPNSSNRFSIEMKIGSGSLADVYLGTNIRTKEQVALKVVQKSMRRRHDTSVLQHEFNVYGCLAGGLGIPTAKGLYGQDDYDILVLGLLGPSLQDMFNFCGRTFSLKTVLLLADQLISVVEYIHSKGYLHKSLKPDNLLMPMTPPWQVHVIDFQRAERYSDIASGAHLPHCNNQPTTHTSIFASIHSHRGGQQSRRDDLESLGYVFVYFLRGGLPWQGVKLSKKRKVHAEQYKIKAETSLEKLCRGFPEEFRIYCEYCRSLRYEERPDYDYLRNLFRHLCFKQGLQRDDIFDWTRRESASFGQSA